MIHARSADSSELLAQGWVDRTGGWDRGQVTVSHNWDTDLTPVPTPVYFSLICLLTCALNRFHSFS